jgi:hypothetical protein
MLRTIILVLVSSALMNNAYSQIESLSPLEYEMMYKTEDRYFFKIDLYNPTENDILFKWTVDYNFELTSDFSYFNTDLDQEYVPGILSICNRPLINTLPPKDTMPIYVGFNTKEILPDVLAMGPELNYYLQSPNCDSTYLHYTFKIIDRSVAIIEQLGGDFNVYPNPASGIINIDIPQDGKGQVIIYNNLGQVVMGKKITSVSDTENLNISSLQNGQYRLLYIPKRSSSKSVYYSGFLKM